MSKPTPSTLQEPLQDFSHCHDGILRHLEDLAALPALIGPAQQARRIAAGMLAFFRPSVFEHHEQEEAELFPAVLASAELGPERDQVKAIADRLTAEHRMVESRWAKLEPALRDVARGRDTALDPAAVSCLVGIYQAHARFEEETFLPLARTILGRNSNHMAALGLSLHLRHAAPELLARFGHRI